MRSPAEAIAQILECVRGVEETERVRLEHSVGRVLAQPVFSDVDLPPFEKSAVDGFAVHSADFASDRAPAGERSLPILGESRAGAPYMEEVPRGACVAIYTGAEVPRGPDAIVMVEDSVAEGGGVLLRARPKPLQHICKRGQDLASGQEVFPARHRIRISDLSALASVGCQPATVYRRPRAAVLTTGDELVRPEDRPGRGQIREGNTLHLAAMARAAGADVLQLGVLRDDESELARALGEALEQCDVLITTGGVSMGKYDLVGVALERLGVTPLFHKVAIKPGKPLWFGMHGRVPVFALPGNPVSCLVNHEVFVRPAIEKLSNEDVPERMARSRRGRWLGAALEPNTREQYLPVRLLPGDDGVEELEPVPWNGSADVIGIARAEGLAVVPIAARVQRGDPLEYRPLA
jgi:molybdopterin molybdotransferase